MKFVLTVPIFLSSVSAFAPNALKISSTSLAAYPAVNGWTTDENAFCAGLPGALALMGDFDPLGFTADFPVQKIKGFREAEAIHGLMDEFPCLLLLGI